MNSNLFYCQQKVAPIGSDWHYALLGLEESSRNLILALLTLNEEWRSIIHLVHEPALAEAKFHWWQTELTNSFKNNDPQHPAMKLLTCSPDGTKLHPGYDYLQKILSAYQDKIQPIFYATEAERATQPFMAQNIYRVIATLLTPSINTDYLDHLSSGLFLCDLIIHLRAHLQQAEIPFAQDTLKKYQIELQDLQQLKSSPGLEKLLHDQFNQANQFLKNISTNLSSAERKQQKPLLRYVKLQLKLLAEIAAENFPVLTTQISLTPIRKLLICWF